MRLVVVVAGIVLLIAGGGYRSMLATGGRSYTVLRLFAAEPDSQRKSDRLSGGCQQVFRHGRVSHAR